MGISYQQLIVVINSYKTIKNDIQSSIHECKGTEHYLQLTGWRMEMIKHSIDITKQGLQATGNHWKYL